MGTWVQSQRHVKARYGCTRTCVTQACAHTQTQVIFENQGDKRYRKTMLTSTPAHTVHTDHRHTDIETHQTKTRKIQYKKSQEAPASFPGAMGWKWNSVASYYSLRRPSCCFPPFQPNQVVLAASAAAARSSPSAEPRTAMPRYTGLLRACTAPCWTEGSLQLPLCSLQVVS